MNATVRAVLTRLSAVVTALAVTAGCVCVCLVIAHAATGSPAPSATVQPVHSTTWTGTDHGVRMTCSLDTDAAGNQSLNNCATSS
jgi:hypothetical protein